MSQNFPIFNFFHPIVISEILSFSPKILRKNIAKPNFLRNFVLENSSKNKQIFFRKLQSAGKTFDLPKLTRSMSRRLYYKARLDLLYLSSTPIKLHSFVGRNNITMIRFFINNYEDIDINIGAGRTVLYKASLIGRNEIVKLLLKVEDIDVNKQGYAGQTPLMAAIKESQYKIAKMLLNHHDIDVNIVNRKGFKAWEMLSFTNDLSEEGKELQRMLMGKNKP